MQSTTLAKFVGAIVYSVLAAIASAYALKHLKTLQPDTGGGAHEKSVRALVLAPSKETSGLDSVGGCDTVKRNLRKWVLLPLRYPHVFYSVPSLRPCKGVLLHGPPGTGKTMIARAVAAECGVPFVSLHAAALENKWWGESSKLLNAAFRLARKELAPCILFFDEIDGLGRARNETDQACVYSLKCELLRNMDGIETDPSTPTIVLACTNCPNTLDPALRRRFGRRVHMDRPTGEERYDILCKLTRDEACTEEAVLRRVAAASEGMTGSDLASLYSHASSERMTRHMGCMEKDLETGTVSTGDDLLRRLGPLLWEHWSAGGTLREPTAKEGRKKETPGAKPPS